MSGETPRSGQTSTSTSWLRTLQLSIDGLQRQLGEVQQTANRAIDRVSDLRRDVERLEGHIASASEHRTAISDKTANAVATATRVAHDLNQLADTIRAAASTQPINVGSPTGPNIAVRDEEIRARTAVWRGLAGIGAAMVAALTALAAWLAVRSQ